MWADAQRDGRPAKYRWRPLFNAAKSGWRTILGCRAVTLPTRETRWKQLGCPKLPDRSEPLVGRSSPYYQDMWRRYCCLTSFFPIVDTCLSCEDIARQSCTMVRRWRLFGDYFASCISSEPRAARFRPASLICTQATPCVESMADIQSPTIEIRRGKKKGKKKNKRQDENILWPALLHWAAINNTNIAATARSLNDQRCWHWHRHVWHWCTCPPGRQFNFFS